MVNLAHCLVEKLVRYVNYTSENAESMLLSPLGLRSRLFLSRFPHLGRARDADLRAGLRSFPIGAYVLIYRMEGEDVTILRVLRGSRDLQALFGV